MSESHLTLPMAAIPAGAVFSAVMAIQMKNLEALAAVQKAALESIRAWFETGSHAKLGWRCRDR